MRRLVLLPALMLAMFGLLAAQDSPQVPDSPVGCTYDDINTYYNRLVEEGVDAFTFASPPDRDNVSELDPTLMAFLYEAGKALQAQMIYCGYIPEDIASQPVGGDTSLERALEILDTLMGDPLRGQALYLGQERSSENIILGCGGCHEGDAPVGPPTEGTWTRWDEQYSQLPAYAEQPFEYFAAESILYPNAHVETGYLENVMPPFYATALGYKDLADIITFLESQDQLPAGD